MKYYKPVRNLITIITLIFVLTCMGYLVNKFVFAKETQETYLPPHPYPEPGNPAFPAPEDVIKNYTGDYSVEDITMGTQYWRDEQFKDELSQIKDKIDDMDETDVPEKMKLENFTVIQNEIINAYSNAIERAKEKENYLKSDQALNDNISSDIDDGDSTVDSQIKQEINCFFNGNSTINSGTGFCGEVFVGLVPFIEQQITEIKLAATVDDLGDFVDKTQAFIYGTNGFDYKARTLGAKIAAQRILHFSQYVQLTINYTDCVLYQLGPNGQIGVIPSDEDSTTDDPWNKYYNFIIKSYPQGYNYSDEIFDNPYSSENSMMHTNWYSRNTIKADNKYRPWVNPQGTLGAREEYKEAAKILSSSNCSGANSSCIESAGVHMKKGKYLLQDIFHVIYWGYDYFNVLAESGEIEGLGTDKSITAYESELNAVCPFPDVPWMAHSQNQYFMEGFKKTGNFENTGNTYNNEPIETDASSIEPENGVPYATTPELQKEDSGSRGVSPYRNSR